MPELPEVETVVSELRPKLKNKTIREVRVLLPKMVALGPQTLPNLRKTEGGTARKFSRALAGKKVAGISRRAKLIIIDLAGRFALLVHLKMTGQLIFLGKRELGKPVRLLNIENYPAVRLPAKSTHVIFEFTDGSRLYYNDSRQFGYLKLVADRELPQVKELAGYGPEPLSSAFTYPAFEEILKRRPKAKLKGFLMDPEMVAGIGNIYSDEIMFYAKVRPSRLVGRLSGEEKKRLYRGIKKILKDAVKKYGSSVGDFVRPSGDWGAYGLVHKVYGRKGRPCKVCGTMIKSQKFNGRTSSFCPSCQK